MYNYFINQFHYYIYVHLCIFMFNSFQMREKHYPSCSVVPSDNYLYKCHWFVPAPPPRIITPASPLRIINLTATLSPATADNYMLRHDPTHRKIKQLSRLNGAPPLRINQSPPT